MTCEYCWGQDFPGCEKCDPEWNNVITCPKCQGAGRIKKSGGLLTEINNSGTASKNCHECLDTGFVGDNGAGKKYNNEYHPCGVCEKGRRIAGDCERKIYELSVVEFKKLWIECYEELEQHKLDTSMEEYKRLTDKRGEAHV